MPKVVFGGPGTNLRLISVDFLRIYSYNLNHVEGRHDTFTFPNRVPAPISWGLKN